MNEADRSDAVQPLVGKTDDSNLGLGPKVLDEPDLKRKLKRLDRVERLYHRAAIVGFGIRQELKIRPQGQQPGTPFMGNRSEFELVRDLFLWDKEVIRPRQ